MADNTQTNAGAGGDVIRDKDRSGVKTQIAGLDINIGGAAEKLMEAGQQTMANSMPVVIAIDQDAVPVLGPLTDTQLRAADVKVTLDGEAITGPLTDTQLRATPVPVSGIVTASGPLTDTQLRATAVPVSGPLTDTQLRATPVPVSGTVTANAAIANGSDVAKGTTTDAAASSSVAEDTIARTGIGLWKGIKNILILINAKLAALGQAAMAASMPVAIASDQSSVPTKGVGFNIPVTLTVTNGAYTIADVVGGLITFAGAASAAGKRSIINTVILSGVVANPYELWLFASDIATPAADNAVFTLVAADVAMCKGVIPIAAGDYNAPASAFNVATLKGVGHEFTCTVTTLYGYLKPNAVTSPGTTTLTLTILGEFLD